MEQNSVNDRKGNGKIWLSIVTGLFIGFIVLFIMGYAFHLDWTGATEHLTTKVPPYQTVWDWLQLLVVPVGIGFGGFWLNKTQNERIESEKRDRSETERNTADENQREATLQGYIDKLSKLLIDKQLLNSGKDNEVRTIARVRTLTALPRLDELRKRSILLFLYESKLINKGEEVCIIDLRDADLRYAYLSRATLSGINLSGTNLSSADLSGAKLPDADLSGAQLGVANLSEANLLQANLNQARLVQANLFNADLRGAKMLQTNLYDADLREAKLRGADLTGAILTEADLTRADLTDANLTGEDPTRDDLTQEDFTKIISASIELLKSQAKSLQNTIMPDGQIYLH